MLARFEALGVPESTVRRILHDEGLLASAPEREEPRDKPPRRFERTEPNQLWQSDITSTGRSVEDVDRGAAQRFNVSAETSISRARSHHHMPRSRCTVTHAVIRSRSDDENRKPGRPRRSRSTRRRSSRASSDRRAARSRPQVRTGTARSYLQRDAIGDDFIRRDQQIRSGALRRLRSHRGQWIRLVAR